MIDRGDIRQAVFRCSNIWASRDWLWSVQTRSNQPDAKIKKQAERSERLMYERSAIISLWYHHIVCLSWAVNHYRDNAIAYKAQRDKMPEIEAGERGNY